MTKRDKCSARVCTLSTKQTEPLRSGRQGLWIFVVPLCFACFCFFMCFYDLLFRIFHILHNLWFFPFKKFSEFLGHFWSFPANTRKGLQRLLVHVTIVAKVPKTTGRNQWLPLAKWRRNSGKTDSFGLVGILVFVFAEICKHVQN